MKRKQKLSIAAVIVLVSVITAVTAASSILNTPLFMYRMEQASSEMNFLPTAMNTFIYTTEKGCTLQYNDFGEYCGDITPEAFTWLTCTKTCYGSTQGCGCEPTITCNHTFCTCMPPPCPLKAP